MDKQIDKSIIQRTKDALQIVDELSSIELLKIIKDYRKKFHPDRFTDKNAREKADEKFKYFGGLIDELKQYIENEKLQRGAKELALFEPLYNNVYLQNKLDEAKEKIEDLNGKIDALNRENKELSISLEKKRNKALEEENDLLKQLYKPSNQKLASLGILFLLSSSFAVMSKIEEVSSLIKKYSPFPEMLLNNIIFGLFIFMLLLVVKQYFENRIISLKVSEVCSPKFSNEFWAYLNAIKEWEEDKTKDFTEEDVFYFIHSKNSKFKKILATLGFRLCQVETSDRLKNFVINTLLNKKLIEISFAKGLDRTFTIKEGRKKYYYFNRD